MITEANPPSVQRTTRDNPQSETMGDTIPKDAPGVGATSIPTIPLKVHFIKSSCFRVVHASGVWYGGDGHNNLHLTVFNERNAIPRMVVVNVNEQGQVMGEDQSQRQSKEGVIREMEVDLVFSMRDAVEFYKSLGDNLRALKAI